VRPAAYYSIAALPYFSTAWRITFNAYSNTYLRLNELTSVERLNLDLSLIDLGCRGRLSAVFWG